MTKKIQLSNGKGVTLVDDEDFVAVSQHSWHIQSRGYAAAWINGAYVLLRRWITKAPCGTEIDHINRNKLDNLRCNLRPCTHSQNLANRSANISSASGKKGVTWYRRDKKWHAQIKVNGQNIHLGYFENLQDAADVYDKAAVIYFGAFAKTNAQLAEGGNV